MKFYARRIVFYLITIWAAVSLNFFLPRLLPGNPVQILLDKMGRRGDIPESVLNNIHLLLGDTSKPLLNQYFEYWGALFQGELGISVTHWPTPVADLLADALPWTIALVGIATVITFILGISIGALVGWKRGTWLDNLIPSTTILQAVPYFWLAMLLVYLFSVKLGVTPINYGYDVRRFRHGAEFSWEFIQSALYHGTLPALTIVLSAVGGWLLGMRNMTVSTLSEDYITTAEAKGLRPRRIFMTYAVRNAAIPSIAGFSISLGFVVAGSIVMEQVFTYPGIGRLMIAAVQNNDYALMQGVFLVITLTVLAASFIMDLLYGIIDPRARHNV